MSQNNTEPSAELDPLSTEVPVSYDNEDVVWQGSPSQVVNLGTYLFWGVFVIAAVFGLLLWNAGMGDSYDPLVSQAVLYALYGLIVVGLLSMLMAYLSVKCERTVITRNKIKESRGITSIFRQDLFCEISDIKDFKSPPAGLMGLFGLSTLVIETNDEDQPIIRIRAIRDRDSLVQTILPIWRKLKMDRKGYFGERQS